MASDTMRRRVRRVLWGLLLGSSIAGCSSSGSSENGETNGPAITKRELDPTTASLEEVCDWTCSVLCPGEYDDSYYREVAPEYTPAQRCYAECTNTAYLTGSGDSVPTPECLTADASYLLCRASLKCEDRQAEIGKPRCQRICGLWLDVYEQECRCQPSECPESDVGGRNACRGPDDVVITSFVVSPNCVGPGDAVTITWSAEKVSTCTLRGPMDTADPNEVKEVPANGTVSFTSQVADLAGCVADNRWVLTCENDISKTSEGHWGCGTDCLDEILPGSSGGGGSSACDECLDGCQGLSSCCTGSGCICQDACQPEGCSAGMIRCCDDYGFCMCVADCPFG